MQVSAMQVRPKDPIVVIDASRTHEVEAKSNGTVQGRYLQGQRSVQEQRAELVRQIGDTAEAVAAVEDYAYLADAESGQRMMDVSRVGRAREIGAMGASGYAHNVEVVWPSTFVTDGGPGLRIVDLSDTLHPTEVAYYEAPGDAPCVAVARDHIYVADSKAGLVISNVAPSSLSEKRLYAVRAIGTPVIDGNLNKWEGAPFVDLNDTTADYHAGDVPDPDTNDLSLRMYSAWNASYVWFALHVTDDKIITDSSTMWYDDEIELALDGLNDGQAHWFEDDHQYLFTPDGRVQDFNKPNPLELQYAIRQVTGGWNVEVRVPNSALGYTHDPLALGQIIGLNLGIHDDDNGGTYDTHLIWSGSSTTNSQNYGKLVLSERTHIFPSSGSTPTATLEATPSTEVPPNGTVVSLSPTNAIISGSSGQTSIEVPISHVSELGGFQFTLSYNPSVVHVESVSLGDFLASTGRNASQLGPQIDNDLGQVTFGAFTFGTPPGPSGDGVLATIVFSAQSVGESALAFTQFQATNVSGAEIPTTVQNGSIEVIGNPTGTSTPTFTATPTVSQTPTPIPTVTSTLSLPTTTPTPTPSVPPTPNIPSATTVRILPESLTLSTNAITGTVGVEIQRVSNLGAFQITLAYDPTIVHVEKMVLGTFLGSSGRNVIALPASIDNDVGKATFGAFSFGSQDGPSGSGILAHAFLSPQFSGASALALHEVQVTDTQGKEIQTVTLDGTVTTEQEMKIYIPMVSR